VTISNFVETNSAGSLYIYFFSVPLVFEILISIKNFIFYFGWENRSNNPFNYWQD
jgi:hypothetical protein